jgi:hypothetical protein
MSKREAIAALNDELRTTFSEALGHIHVVPDPRYDPEQRLLGRALLALRAYTGFEKNGYHDAGVFIFGGYSFEWWIRYVKRDGELGAPDPTDPSKTYRILTLEVTGDDLAAV